MTENYTYWIRTSLGLEKVALEEVGESVSVKKSAIEHRSVLIETTLDERNEANIRNLKTIDDAYELIGTFKGVDKTKSSIEPLLGYFKRIVLPAILAKENSGAFRITVSFLGKRNFNRFFVENGINKVVLSSTEFSILSNEKKEPHEKGELRLRCHIEGNLARFGIAISDTPLHRREWRSESYEGQLHPPIAAAMARFSRSKSPTRIIDPFCGSGTILIESSSINPTIEHVGIDLNPKVISIAKNNSLKAGTRINFLNTSAFDQAVDYGRSFIVSNPPWGDKHQINLGENKNFLKKLTRSIRESDGAVLIMPEDFAKEISADGLLVEELVRTRVNGKLAIISYVRRGMI